MKVKGGTCAFRICLFLIGWSISINSYSQDGPRVITSFDNGWKFTKDAVSAAEHPSYNDAQWRTLNVPHDWSIEGSYDRNNSTNRGGGYLPGGVGWYRRSFTLNKSDSLKKVFIEFDGIMANSDVWINGHHLGKRPNGYVSFQYELSGHLNFREGKTNVLAVRADNSVQPASRWYTGAGIYRHVRLIVTNAVHIAQWGSVITSSNRSGGKWLINASTNISNQTTALQNIIISTDIIDPAGNIVGSVKTAPKKIAPGQTKYDQSISINNPLLWNVDDPKLYRAVTKIFSGKQQMDELSVPFGIREARFEAATGFWLNGKNIKIKGVCLHHDAGGLGTAVPLAAWKKRLTLLKETGVNGIRTSHNAVAPEFLDLCDQMGFLVMDETFDSWNTKKPNAERGYNLYFTDWWERDTRDIVMRDRNHPSIVIYSVGNEIHDNLNDSAGFRKYKMQQDLIHLLDTSRPVTMALFRPALSKVYENGFAKTMDIVGQNYRENELIAAHDKNPNWKVTGTENRHEQAAWVAMRDHQFIAGQFLWTGIDYLGEADWPKVTNGSGLFDRALLPRDIAYQRKSWWSDQPVVHLIRKDGNDWVNDWSPTDPDIYTSADLQVFSNCDEVELFLNGKSVAVQSRPADNASPMLFTIDYQKGTLKAVGKNNGKIVTEQQLTTSGVPAKIILAADRSTIENKWDDMVYITATIADEKGTPCLNADDKVTFDVTGPGFIAAVDNGDLSTSDPFMAKERWAYKGRCIAIIKANAMSGTININASAAGMQPAAISLSIKNIK